MNNESVTIAQKTFDGLPRDIQETIFSDDYQAFLADITKRFLLTNEQSNALEFQTTMVLIGQAKQEYFQFDLESELGINEDIAQKISTEIQESVFSVVSDSLEQLKKNAEGTDEDLEKLLNKEESVEPTEETLPSGSNSDTVLAALGERLNKSSVIAPTKRDYSVSTIGDITPPEPKAFDPYRELPEK